MVHVELAIVFQDSNIVNFLQETTRMKKILVLALGLGVVLGTLSFAQDSTSTDKKMEKKSKKKKKTDDTDKK
jgi:uncharacterized metal-binding protein